MLRHGGSLLLQNDKECVSDQVIIESCKKQWKCLTKKTVLRLERITSGYKSIHFQQGSLGTVLFSTADISDEWSAFIPLDQSHVRGGGSDRGSL